jgi:hypothetical protein
MPKSLRVLDCIPQSNTDNARILTSQKVLESFAGFSGPPLQFDF